MTKISAGSGNASVSGKTPLFRASVNQASLSGNLALTGVLKQSARFCCTWSQIPQFYSVELPCTLSRYGHNDLSVHKNRKNQSHFGQLTEVNILPICKQQLQMDCRCHSVRFNRHQTNQSSFYLCCNYKGVGVYFAQRFVTSDMTEKKIGMTEIIVDSQAN